MIMMKTSFVVLVLFQLWISSGAAPFNSVDWCINNPCDRFASCHNSPTNYTCTCLPGFETHGSHCRDINECYVNGQQIDEEICGQHAKCRNTQGSFVCTCNTGFYRDTFQCYALPREDCSDIREQGHTTSGIYTVYLGESQRALDIYCDMTSDSVGWTVFQRRQDGSVDFLLKWAAYQKGFGDILGEFWIGNDNLHLLTSNKRYKLRVELTAFDGSTVFAEYDNFKVASAADKYQLTSIGTYSGTAGDSLTRHVGMQFTTKDQDNDKHPSANCAVDRKGAWWYSACADSNLNGVYHKTQTDNEGSVNWYLWKNSFMSLRRVEMKLTPFV